MATRQQILKKISIERDRQIAKWGEQHHPDQFWFLILTEELGEVARALYEGDPAHAYKELVEVAAVAAAWLEDKYSNGKTVFLDAATGEPAGNWFPRTLEEAMGRDQSED